MALTQTVSAVAVIYGMLSAQHWALPSKLYPLIHSNTHLWDRTHFIDGKSEVHSFICSMRKYFI